MNHMTRINQIFPAEAEVPADLSLGEPLEQRQYLVNGELRHWDGPLQEVHSPIYLKGPQGLTQKLLGRYPLLGEEEALEILAAAVRAYNHGHGSWPAMPVRERISHLEQFAFRMGDHKQEVVRLLMWEVGKSYQDSVKEFDRTIDYLRATIEAMKELDRVSSRFVMEQGIIGQIRRAPLGVALCMGPFNYPLNETFSSLIPALIMGNAVILKPPKLGVLLYSPLLAALRDSFPPGVINTVYGHGPQVAGPLMASGQVDVLAFVGTSKAGDILKKQHPKPHRLRSSLGLDAKNQAIILPDAPMAETIAECLLGALSFNGQRCTALKLLFVHQAIADEFLEKFSQAVAQLKFAMPWEPEVTITPLAEATRPGYLQELLDDALGKGARVVNEGGGVMNRSFVYPAIIYPVDERMRLFHEEQFGPLIPVAPFTDLETVIEGIVNSQYGQQVSIFSMDDNLVAPLIDRLVTQVGRVNLNSQSQRGPDILPFTGRKDSAEGTLSVHDALRVFSLRTLVAARSTEINKALMTRIIRDQKSNFLSIDYIF
jgi:glyceraldehyde-3-phosphate dehydrogenase (NADP+)